MEFIKNIDGKVVKRIEIEIDTRLRLEEIDRQIKELQDEKDLLILQ